MNAIARTRSRRSLPFALTAAVAVAVLAAASAWTDARAEEEPAPPQPGPGATLDSTLRFRNAPVITAVRDPHASPRPAAREFLRSAYFFDAYLGQRSVRLLARDPSGRALAVNALDEVPDSSWFQNRAGARPISPGEIHDRRLAPPKAPFTVMGTKLGGTSLGMRVRDANGAGFLLKFDAPGDPDGQTAADLVVQRLLWACGYHTAEDTIIDLGAEDLHLHPKAVAKTNRTLARPMVEADITTMLSAVERRPDGRYQALMSRLLDGVPVGGFPQQGVRPDDPNDVVPHEDRRDVRGARVFFSWLNHVDIKEDNFLDTWIEDPATPGRGQVRHNLVDFGNSLGIFGWKVDPTVGFSELWDARQGLRGLVSFGLWRRPWEGLQSSPLRGVGNLESARFDPVGWRPQYPWAPFERFDRFDGSWAARILMSISPEVVAAAVAEGRYRDPRAAAYITRTLVERQRKIGWHYLRETRPLEAFTIAEGEGGARLCFEDPLIGRFAGQVPALAATTRHRVATWDHAGRSLPARFERPGAARVCLDGLRLPADHDGYAVIDIETTRGAGSPRNRVLVHVARAPETGSLRVIGLRRL